MTPTLFRPPLGRITLSGLRAARRLGLKTVHWSVEAADWALRSPEASRDRGERLSRAVGLGDIVLLHDDNPCVVTLLGHLLPDLASRGFDLEGASQLFWTNGRRSPGKSEPSGGTL